MSVLICGLLVENAEHLVACASHLANPESSFFSLATSAFDRLGLTGFYCFRLCLSRLSACRRRPRQPSDYTIDHAAWSVLAKTHVDCSAA
jgi:hypothetical protein